MSEQPDDILTRRALSLSKIIQPMLKGEGPEVQGACLADLVSLFFAGHHPALRDQVISDWVAAMRSMIPPSEAQIREQRGPLPWDK